MKKLCIICQEPCDIYAIRLGDFATLTYLRICSPECLFKVTHEYLYSINKHKEFRNHLYDLQNEEDKAERDADLDASMKESLKLMSESLKKNPRLFTHPAPDFIKMFLGPKIPENSSQTMRFRRYEYTKEDRIEWKKDYISELNRKLAEAAEELAKIEAE